MCGIAGYVLQTPIKHSHLVQSLLEPIRQRGPDDEGCCLVNRQHNHLTHFRTHKTSIESGKDYNNIEAQPDINEHHIGLIHTRYAIIDLSPGGHQPFSSADDSLVAIFNGEIYNYLEIRSELAALGVNCLTSSDTEVIVEGYRVWGDSLWSKLNGFWAVALYDRNSDKLVLSRDRLGVAPLYYRETRNGLYFASSIQSLVNIDSVTATIDTDKLLGFISTGMKDFNDSTFYCEIRSIPAATTISLASSIISIAEATSFCFWRYPKNRLSTRDIKFSEAIEMYRDTFFNAVEIRLRADVKVACELSGGLDSSSIVAAAALLRSNKITTYTIKVPEYDEEPYAKLILEKYPIDYRVLVDPEETFFTDVNSFTKLMEEPYHSPNIYTHFKMRSAMKRDGVSVVLSGSGGDEVLAGYEGPFLLRALEELWHTEDGAQAMKYIIARGNTVLREIVKSEFDTAPQTWKRLNRSLKFARNVLWRRFKASRSSNLSSTTMPTAAVYQSRYESLSFHEQVLHHFQVAMLPYYLRSNDHFTMAIPLEQRFPFLDYRMVELGLQLPVAYLYKDGWTKYILRKAMEPYLPAGIVWRKYKMGFPFPYERFLSQHRERFEPMLKDIEEFSIPSLQFSSYEKLLTDNAVQLWRMCSVAIWLKSVRS